MLVGLVEELAVDEASSCMVGEAILLHWGHTNTFFFFFWLDFFLSLNTVNISINFSLLLNTLLR